MHMPFFTTATRLASFTLGLLAMAAAPIAAVETSTWTGAALVPGTATVDPNFSNDANWTAPPTPDCIMVFPPGVPFGKSGAPFNDMTGLTINQLNISEAYIISGNAITCKNINDSYAGIVTLDLPISTAGSAVLTVTVSSDTATLNLAGILSGAGPVTYSGPGIKRLNGTANNILTGLSIVAQGNLVLDSAANESIAGPLQIDYLAYCTLLSAPEIKNDQIVTVNGTFTMSAATGNDGADKELIGGLAGTDISAFVNVGANTLGSAGQVAATNYLGGFQGTGGFRQSSSGIQILSGTSQPYTGATTVAGGEIHIWHRMLESPVTVTSGTLVLANNASVGPVVLSGGSSVLSCDETSSAMPARATTPSLTVGAGSTYSVVAKSPTDYSQVSTAVVNISGALLSVDTSAFAPGAAVVLEIITNTGASPVSGTFAGLADGATVVSASNPGTTMTIDYFGGTGNDVTLTGSTPVGDVTAPVITSVATSGITGSAATVTWTTDEASTSRVQYGLTTWYGNLTAVDTIADNTAHSVNVTGLATATLYHYRVQSKDAAGNLAYSPAGTFTTSATGDTAAPVVTATAASNTGTAATVTWTTNEVSSSQVAYGTSPSFERLTTLNSSMVTAHSVTVSGLSVSTLYYYRVLSWDAAGNLVTGATRTLTTNAVSTTPPPAVVVSGSVANDDDGKCGAGSAIAILAMALMYAMQLHAPRRSPRD